MRALCRGHLRIILVPQLHRARNEDAAAEHVEHVKHDVAVLVAPDAVQVSLEKHVVHHQRGADQGRALLRRDRLVVDLELVDVRVREQLTGGGA